MIFFLAILIVYWFVLVIYKPQNISLRDNSIKKLGERVRDIKGTLFLGTFIVLIALVSFDFETLRLDNSIAVVFGLSKTGVIEGNLFFQIVTSNFLHFDLFHLGANASVLMLLSAYERRVGSKRYIAIFAVAAIVSSIIDLFLLGDENLTLGASAGISGLACAFFIDYGKLSIKEWISGLTFSLFVVAISSVYNKSQLQNLGYEINWISHLLGVFVIAFYVKLKPGKEKMIKEGRTPPLNFEEGIL